MAVVKKIKLINFMQFIKGSEACHIKIKNVFQNKSLSYERWLEDKLYDFLESIGYNQWWLSYDGCSYIDEKEFKNGNYWIRFTFLGNGDGPTNFCSLTFDKQDRLIKLTAPGEKISYSYDEQGQLIASD
jgi:YD repeat-containing protein